MQDKTFEALEKIMDSEVNKPFNEELKQYIGKKKKSMNEEFGIEVPKEEEDASPESSDAPVDDAPSGEEGAGEEGAPQEQEILAQGKWKSGDFEITIDGSSLTVVNTADEEAQPVTVDLMSAEAVEEEAPAEEGGEEEPSVDVNEGFKATGKKRKGFNEFFNFPDDAGLKVTKITDPQQAVELCPEWFRDMNGFDGNPRQGSGAATASKYLQAGPLYLISHDSYGGKVALVSLAHDLFYDTKDNELSPEQKEECRAAIIKCEQGGC